MRPRGLPADDANRTHFRVPATAASMRPRGLPADDDMSFPRWRWRHGASMRPRGLPADDALIERTVKELTELQ